MNSDLSTKSSSVNYEDLIHFRFKCTKRVFEPKFRKELIKSIKYFCKGYVKNLKINISVHDGNEINDVWLYKLDKAADDLVDGIEVKGLRNICYVIDVDGKWIGDEDDLAEAEEYFEVSPKTDKEKVQLWVLNETCGDDPINAYAGEYGGDYAEYYQEDGKPVLELDWVREGYISEDY